jgi:mRNA interferase MazF
MAANIPNQGDYITVTFDPQSGQEQKGRRPSLVISHALFNAHTGLAMVCPITNTRRQSPFHVAIADNEAVTGFILVKQIKSLDFHARNARRISKASSKVLGEVLALLDACIY